jgi:hypothetical protein
MSIKEFTEALRNRANQTAVSEAQTLLQNFVTEADKAFNKKGIVQAASVLSTGKVTVGGKEVNLSQRFRELGEKQGRTALILTEDDLIDIFKRFNIISNVKPIVAYLKFLSKNYKAYMARHYEVYFSDGTVLDKETSYSYKRKTIADVINSFTKEQLENIIAVRGLNFSHKNTLIHVAHFLHDLNAFPGKTRKDVEKILSGSYDRGHIYAQTYGRAIVSLGDLAAEDNILTRIVKLYQLLDEGTTSLNTVNGKYNELLARANKDFTSDHLRMNIQLQSILENRDSGSISQAIQIVGFLQNLIQNSKLSRDGKRQLGQPAATSIKEFEKALLDFDKKLQNYAQRLNEVLKNTNNPDYLLELRTSDSIPDYIPKLVDDILTGKGTNRKIKVNTRPVSVLKSKPYSAKVSSSAKSTEKVVARLKNELKTVKSQLTTPKRIKVTGSIKVEKDNTILNLLTLLNSELVNKVKNNMGDGSRKDILNLRTGRFAESVKIVNLTQSKSGMISAFYNYMRNPYGTFSQGGRQQYPRSRDPKLLISKSIRELAQQQAINRLRAVLV